MHASMRVSMSPMLLSSFASMHVSMSLMLLSSLVIWAARPSMVGGGGGGSDLWSPGIADTRLLWLLLDRGIGEEERG